MSLWSQQTNQHHYLDEKKINIRLYCYHPEFITTESSRLVCLGAIHFGTIYQWKTVRIVEQPTPFVAFKALAPIEMKLLSAISKKD